MAKIRGAISRALLLYPDLDLRHTRLIGWGAGQWFRDYFPLINLPIEYTVCPNVENQGKVIHGINVESPERLKQESTSNVLVVIIASHAPEIMNQIRDGCGPYRTVRAIDFRDNYPEIDEFKRFSEIFNELTFVRKPIDRADLGIFTQGPIFPYTPLTLAYQRLRNPSAYSCFVTWDHQSPEQIAACVPWVDSVLTIRQPENLGLGNRNAILRSSRVGAEHLANEGIKYAVRCRSDAVINGSIYSALHEMYDDGTKNTGRIGVYLGASWKNIPFHFSDKFMIAQTKDMVELWSLSEDNRQADMFDFANEDHFLSLRNVSWESHLWANYANRMGYATKDLADSYRFAHAKLIPLEPKVDMLSIKHIPLFNISFDNSYIPTSKWWKEMQGNLDSALIEANEISSMNLTVRDFMQGKVG